MKYKLRRCVWEITLACCFNCRYCGSRAGQARENELDTDECLKVADELIKLGCIRVSLIGGEVFMRRDWKEIVMRLTRGGVAVNIITNGYLFNEKILDVLRSSGIESISVRYTINTDSPAVLSVYQIPYPHLRVPVFPQV